MLVMSEKALTNSVIHRDLRVQVLEVALNNRYLKSFVIDVPFLFVQWGLHVLWNIDPSTSARMRYADFRSWVKWSHL